MPALLPHEKVKLINLDKFLGAMIAQAISVIESSPEENPVIAYRKSLGDTEFGGPRYRINCKKINKDEIDVIKEQDIPFFLTLHKNLYLLLYGIYGHSNKSAAPLLSEAQDVELTDQFPNAIVIRGRAVGIQATFRLFFADERQSVVKINFLNDGSCRWPQFFTPLKPTLPVSPSMTSASTSSSSLFGQTSLQPLHQDFITQLFNNCPSEIQGAWSKLKKNSLTRAEHIAVVVSSFEFNLIIKYRNCNNDAELVKFCSPKEPSTKQIRQVLEWVNQAILQEHTLFFSSVTPLTPPPTPGAASSSAGYSPGPQQDMSRPRNHIYHRCPVEVQLVWDDIIADPSKMQDLTPMLIRPIKDQFMAEANRNYYSGEIIRLCGLQRPPCENIEQEFQNIIQTISQECQNRPLG